MLAVEPRGLSASAHSKDRPRVLQARLDRMAGHLQVASDLLRGLVLGYTSDGLQLLVRQLIDLRHHVAGSLAWPPFSK